MATEYRYLFADLLTNQIYAELPLTGVSFGQELNTAGSFSGSLLLTDVKIDSYNIASYTNPARTAIYVDRNGTIVWAGVLWSRDYDSVSQKITFQAREFESYFEKRRIVTTYTATNVDQFTVVEDLFNQIQSVSGGNIGLVIPTNTSGVLVTKTYNDYEQKPLTEAVYELSRSNTGFDWNIDVNYDSSYNIVKTLELAYPRRGTKMVANGVNNIVLEFPGSIVSYKYPEDGSSVATRMYGVGAGTGPGKTLSTQSSTDQLAAGWPLIEQSVSYTDYTDQTLLDNITLASLNAVINPIVVMEVITEAYNVPILGAFRTGDDVRVRITDPWFPTTLDVTRRISKYTVTPGEAGPERITFSLVVTTN